MNKKRLLKSVLINMAVVFVLFLLFHPTEKTDDYIMKLILSGAMSGVPDAHLLYSNYLLGLILKALTILIPFVSWYEIMQYLTLFCAFTAFTYVMFDENRSKVIRTAVIPILLYFGFECYIKLTFTKTAGIAVGVGFLLLFQGLMQYTENNRLKQIVGLLLVFIGSLIRWKIIMAASAIFFGIILISYLKSNHRNKAKHSFIVRSSVLLLVIATTYTLFKIGGMMFKLDPAWADYKEYNTYKVELQDYGWPDYYTYQTEYESLDVTYNDYVMWGNDRNYSDPDRFTNELLSTIISWKESSLTRYLSSFRSFFLQYPQSYVKMTMSLITFSILLLLLSSDHQQKWYVCCYMLLINLALDYYLVANGRYGRTHVEIATWFANCMFICYYLNESEASVDPNKLFSIILLIIATFVYVIRIDSKYINSGTYTGDENTLSHDDARYTLDKFSEHKENLYVVSNDEYYGLMRGYKPWQRVPAGKYSNIFILSSYSLPSSRVLLSKYNVDNIYKSLTQHNVYFATSQKSSKNDSIKILKYIKQHYDSAAYAEAIEIDHGVITYKFDTNLHYNIHWEVK